MFSLNTKLWILVKGYHERDATNPYTFSLLMLVNCNYYSFKLNNMRLICGYYLNSFSVIFDTYTGMNS